VTKACTYRAKPVKRGRGQPWIVIKMLDCYNEDEEEEVRREAAAMKAVKMLTGCLNVLGTYAGILHEIDGGAMYHLTMLCAAPALSPWKHMSSATAQNRQLQHPLQISGLLWGAARLVLRCWKR